LKGLGLYDGKIVDLNKPAVLLEDRGYQFGDGVYDAWKVVDGKHFLRKEHLDRLERSCRLLDIKPCYSREEIEGFSDSLVEESGVNDGAMYLQWTRGWESPRSHVFNENLRPLLSGSIIPIPPLPLDAWTTGNKVITYPDQRHLFCHIKTLNLLGSIMAKNAAHRNDCEEALLVREHQGRSIVTECSSSNCFAVKDGVMYTAPLGNLILPGITRAAILGLAGQCEINVVEEYVSPEFFKEADEAFFTNAIAIRPIVMIDGRPVGSGNVGPVFQKLNAKYQKMMRGN